MLFALLSHAPYFFVYRIFPYFPNLAWPGSVSRLDDIVQVNESHTAGNELEGMALAVLFRDDESASMSISD